MRIPTDRILRHLELVRDKVADWNAYPFTIPAMLPRRDADATAHVAEIPTIYVDPAHWRHGIGSALIEAAIECARKRSFREVSLWVLTANAPARAFYEARQFKADGETKVDDRRGFSIHETRYRRGT